MFIEQWFSNFILFVCIDTIGVVNWKNFRGKRGSKTKKIVFRGTKFVKHC